MTFMSIVFLFPTIPDTDVEGMNFTVVVLGGTLLLSLVYYYFPRYGGKHWFTGPIPTIERTRPSSETDTVADKDKTDTNYQVTPVSS